ncbi:MAG: thiolase family protein, partial [Chloroflexi bacterium]|nr:thiolase family protein [Chloroflexota bacterium]
MSDVRVAGTGLHPFGRFEDRSLTALGAHAARAALAEAGIRPGDRGAIDAVFCGTAYGGVATGHRVLGALALTGVPIVDVEAGCASGAAALALGAAAIRADQYDTVLVLGVEKMPRGMIRSSYFEPWQEAAGLTPAPAYFALRAQRLMRERGLTKDHLAAVVVKNRNAGSRNPDAMFQKPVVAADVLASRVV